MARVINGTEKLAIGPSGDQSHVHTTPGLSIRTETPLHKETNTKHLTTEIKHFSNGLKAVLLFTLTCFTAEIEINASFFPPTVAIFPPFLCNEYNSSGKPVQ